MDIGQKVFKKELFEVINLSYGTALILSWNVLNNHHLKLAKMGEIKLQVWQLGWVDSDLGGSPGWWAATVATYCPSRMVEHPEPKSTQSRFASRWVIL